MLFASAAVAMLWANLHVESYRAIFSTTRSFINDGLMALFFFVVGMEIKEELTRGALSTRARAVLPALAAAGGMLVPALIFARLDPGGAGWGIPVATDIAFCVGVLSMLGDRVPRALAVFITALAVFDDIGGIAVIAIFYGHGLQPAWLVASVVLVFLLWALERRVRLHGVLYAGLGAVLWFTMHQSGLHATLSGVALGLLIPAELKHDTDQEAPLASFVTLWRPWVTWVVLPLFALANAGVPLGGMGLAAFSSPISLGVALGLFIGKPVGIFGVTFAAVKLKLAPLPERTSHYRLFGASIVAGIGFTVSLFIAALAYPGGAELEQAKAGVLLGSLVAGVIGALVLRAAPKLPA
ncbi:MAG: Na+/H+ antiporter NhaA [Myxococcaceae bacterium]|nr:Na+/H+ antiporter NhaA [Myxococcaceae bacterium]